jgi:hypothetical protein
MLKHLRGDLFACAVDSSRQNMLIARDLNLRCCHTLKSRISLRRAEVDMLEGADSEVGDEGQWD